MTAEEPDLSIRRLALEWLVKQSPAFVLLCLLGYWVSFTAFPAMLESHRDTIKELREDDRIMRATLDRLTERTEKQNELLVQMIAELRRQ